MMEEQKQAKPAIDLNVPHSVNHENENLEIPENLSVLQGTVDADEEMVDYYNEQMWFTTNFPSNSKSSGLGSLYPCGKIQSGRTDECHDSQGALNANANPGSLQMGDFCDGQIRKGKFHNAGSVNIDGRNEYHIPSTLSGSSAAIVKRSENFDQRLFAFGRNLGDNIRNSAVKDCSIGIGNNSGNVHNRIDGFGLIGHADNSMNRGTNISINYTCPSTLSRTQADGDPRTSSLHSGEQQPVYAHSFMREADKFAEPTLSGEARTVQTGSNACPPFNLTGPGRQRKMSNSSAFRGDSNPSFHLVPQHQQHNMAGSDCHSPAGFTQGILTRNPGLLGCRTSFLDVSASDDVRNKQFSTVHGSHHLPKNDTMAVPQLGQQKPKPSAGCSSVIQNAWSPYIHNSPASTLPKFRYSLHMVNSDQSPSVPVATSASEQCQNHPIVAAVRTGQEQEEKLDAAVIHSAAKDPPNVFSDASIKNFRSLRTKNIPASFLPFSQSLSQVGIQGSSSAQLGNNQGTNCPVQPKKVDAATEQPFLKGASNADCSVLIKKFQPHMKNSLPPRGPSKPPCLRGIAIRGQVPSLQVPSPADGRCGGHAQEARVDAVKSPSLVKYSHDALHPKPASCPPESKGPCTIMQRPTKQFCNNASSTKAPKAPAAVNNQKKQKFMALAAKHKTDHITVSSNQFGANVNLMPLGTRCNLCNIDLAFLPPLSEPTKQTTIVPIVMPCRHCYHIECLEEVGIFPEACKDPSCPLCSE